MICNESILSLAGEYESELIGFRRKLHSLAEVGGTEDKTKAFIMSVLEQEGLPMEEVVKLLPDQNKIN